MTTVNYTDEVYPDSTLVESAYYDARTQELVVDLNDNLYLYQGVPKETFLGIDQAESPGRFYSENIKRKFGPGSYLGREWTVEYNKVEPPVTANRAVGTPKGLSLAPGVTVTSGSSLSVSTGNHPGLQVSLAPTVGKTRKYTVTFLDARGEAREHTVHATGLDEAIVTVLDIGDMLNLAFTIKSVTVYFE